VRPQEYGGDCEDLDLLVVGGQSFRGVNPKRVGHLVAFTMGLLPRLERDEEEDEEEQGLCRVTVEDVISAGGVTVVGEASNVSDAQLLELEELLRPHMEAFDRSKALPPWMAPWKPSREDEPDMILRHLDKAVVLSIK
jgi:hypothetical protein